MIDKVRRAILCLLVVAMVSHVAIADWSVAPNRGPTTWVNQKTLADHFKRHGTDFGSRSAQHYADQASDFLRSSQTQRLPTKIAPDGTIRVYDPATNTFGSYTSGGATRTFYKPDPTMHPFKTNLDYWNAQPGSSPWIP